jgi:hypothetical protein
MIRAFFGLLGAGMMLAGAAHAQTYQVGQYLGNMNDLNRFTYNTMGSAAQHANYGPGGANWTTLAGQNAARMAGTATATIGGRTVPLTLISRVPVPAIASAARSVAGMHPGVAAAVLLGGLAFDHWLDAGNLKWNPNPVTNVTHPFVKQVESEFSACPTLTASENAQWRDWIASKNGFSCGPGTCTAVAKTWVSQEGMCVWGATTTAPQWDGTVRTQDESYMRRDKVGEPTIELIPYTWEQAEPDLGNILPEKLSAVNWKGITEQLLRAGGSIQPSQITSTVSGPSSQPGERTVTTGKNAQGEPTTTTKQTTHNYTYNNNNVTHNTTTTTTTVNNITNQIENETTEETENKPDESATDSPLPEVPDLYERKYPDGIKGVWDTKSAAIMQSPLFSLASGMVPTIGDGGCPQWSLPVDIGIIDFGVYDISLPCNVWAFVRIVILITALFLVRRLIFGG